MNELVIFGEALTPIEQRADNDSVELKNKKMFITSQKRPAASLLREFLADLLYSELVRIYEQIKGEGKVEVLGDLDFEVVDKIDSKRQRVAKHKGNRVLVKLNAVALPKSALKYVIAHEIAHAFTKRHAKRFWKTVELMCPGFEESRELLTQYGHLVTGELIAQNTLLHRTLE